MKTIYDSLSNKKKAIFDACLKLFYENGFTETSMRDISEVLKINPASLYTHISSKEEILEWIITPYVDTATNAMAEFHCIERSFSQQFRCMVEKNIEISTDTKMLSDVFKRYLHMVDKKIQKRYADFSAEYLSLLTRSLIHYKIEKHIDFDPETAARFLIHSMNNSYKWVPSHYTKAQIVDIFENKIFFGFTGKKLKD